MNWTEFDRRLRIASPFILTDDERKGVASVEQAAYERNLSTLRRVLEDHQAEMQKRSFWTELIVEHDKFSFRYSLPGFYGPGGFRSMFHAAGPLVLATINPAGDAVAAFYRNELADNVFLGESFDEVALASFIEKNLLEYLKPENQILSLDDYTFVQQLLAENEA